MSAALSATEFNEKDASLGRNYLLLGTDAWLTDLVSDAIRRRIRGEGSAEQVIIYGDEIKAAELNDMLDSLSIFSGSKLILLRNAEELEKPELECLAAYLSYPSDQQTLVIAARKIDARIGGWKTIKEKCQIVTCDPPKYSSMLRPWLLRMLDQAGKRMDESAIISFINRVELDFANADNELQKLVLLTQGKKLITENDVLRGIGISRAGTQVDFYKALGGRKPKEALQLVERMLNADWVPLQVLALMNRFYFNIYHILLLKKKHLSSAEIISKHLGDIYPNQRKDFVLFAENYSLAKLPDIFAQLIDADAKIKSTSASENLLLTTCILRILEVA